MCNKGNSSSCITYTHGGLQLWTLSDLTSSLDGGGWWASHSGRLPSRGRVPVPIKYGSKKGPKTPVDNLEHRKVSSPCSESHKFPRWYSPGCFDVTLANDCGDIQRAVLTNRVKYKKLQSINCRTILFFKNYISYSCRAVHSCKCDSTLTVSSQQTFLIASTLDPERLFHPLTHWGRGF